MRPGRKRRAHIRSDDPKAPQKLARLIEQMRQRYRTMKAANRIRKKGGDSLARRLIAQGVPRAEAERVARDGYDQGAIRSLATQIAQLKRRRAEILRNRAVKFVRREFVPGVYYYEDPDAMRLGFESDEPMSSEICAHLATRGFKYAASAGRWQRLLNGNGRKAAKLARVFITRRMG